MPSMFQAAANAAALMERTPFAIDDAKDDDEESDDGSELADDGVMDEVYFYSGCSKRILLTAS